MARFLPLLGGVFIAAALAVALALLFTAGGGEALLLSVGIVAVAYLARVANRNGFAIAGLTLLAFLFAMYAGVQMARGIDGSGPWFATVEAIVAAMVCGSIVALQCLKQLSRREPAQDPHPVDALQDSTIEMEVRSDAAQRQGPDRAPRLLAANAWRPAVALTVVGGALAVILQLASPRASEAPLSTVASTAVAPATDAALLDDVPGRRAALADTPQPSVAADASPQASPAEAISTRLVTRTVTPSLARRECLAQVESAHLFMNIARRASNSSTYTRLTNPEIKRFAASRPVGPYTLQHIAQRMWDRREEPDRDAAWWSQQYARCEEVRIDGGAYVVRG